MNNTPSPHSGYVLGMIGLGVGLVIGYLAALDTHPPANPQDRALDANTWLQTSGEFHALCLQTYRFAGERLAQRLAARRPEAIKSGETRRFAVVMDLDETVLDNSAF